MANAGMFAVWSFRSSPELPKKLQSRGSEVEFTVGPVQMKLLILTTIFGLSFAQHDPHFKNGRTSIVHLFEWRWADIALECERYLAPNGFGGVQISPPSENIVLEQPWQAWYQRYQPISYNLCSRSGTEAELRDMVERCNKVGVNIYADVVINHMCGGGGGEGRHSACGSYFNANTKDFPAVPYSWWDFNDGKCKTASGDIENYGDIFQARLLCFSFLSTCIICFCDLRIRNAKVVVTSVHIISHHPNRISVFENGGIDRQRPRHHLHDSGIKETDFPNNQFYGENAHGLISHINVFLLHILTFMYQKVRDCRLVGLLDLALEKDYVRGKVAEYLNRLIDIGVAGFRVDAGKHMWPGDLQVVFNSLTNLRTKWFPPGTRPLIYQEVIDLGGEPIKSNEYFGLGRVTEFKYSAKLGTVIRRWHGEKMAYLKNWGEGWGFMPKDKSLVFVDNHDNQRGHGAGGSSVLTFWDPRMYKMAVGFMLAHPYGLTRVMSSFRWDRYFENGNDKNDWMGPPSYSNGTTKPVPINPDTTCGDNWVCEHRWRQIKNMVIFRNVVNGQPFSNWWDNGNNQVAFGRGNRGFIVFNNDDWTLDVTLNTGMPGGTYCDVISGQKEGGSCTGKHINVGSDGKADFWISNMDEDPFIAIHADSKL